MRSVRSRGERSARTRARVARMHAVDLRRSDLSALDVDQRVFLHGVSWQDYERLLSIRGDESSPRIAYLAGEIELMSPSRSHERLKKLIARLVEAFALGH